MAGSRRHARHGTGERPVTRRIAVSPAMGNTKLLLAVVALQCVCGDESPTLVPSPGQVDPLNLPEGTGSFAETPCRDAHYEARIAVLEAELAMYKEAVDLGEVVCTLGGINARLDGGNGTYTISNLTCVDVPACHPASRAKTLLTAHFSAFRKQECARLLNGKGSAQPAHNGVGGDRAAGNDRPHHRRLQVR